MLLAGVKAKCNCWKSRICSGDAQLMPPSFFVILQKRGANGPLKHTSVRYAEAVARLKVELQPEKETALTSEDVLDANF